MSENEPEKPRRGWGRLQWSVVGVVLLLVTAFIVEMNDYAIMKSGQMKASSNARQIIGLLLTYASDHDGHYPDHGRDLASLTSNEAFRTLFKERLIEDEYPFGCPDSRFGPDRNPGWERRFDEVLKPGENHWMMTAGLNNRSPGNYPLVLENAAEVSWPPKWLPSPSFWIRKLSMTPAGPPPRGRSWNDNTILVGRNDASVLTVKLEAKNGFLQLPETLPIMPDEHAPLPVLKLLDIEVAE